MVRHTKNFKKGGFAKKVLSAILAASMIMTSSAMVMAAPEESFSAGNEVAVESFSAGGDVDTYQAEPTEVFEGDEEAENVVSVEFLDDSVYNGEAQEPEVQVKVDDSVIDEENYVVTYYNNVNAAKADADNAPYALIQFKGAEYGDLDSVEKTFEIQAASIADAEVVWSDLRGFVYNGTEQYPEVGSVTAKVTVDGKEKKVVLGADDYKIEAISGDLKSVGPKEVKVVGQGNYTGDATSTAEYEIQAADFSEDMVTVNVKPVVYKDTLTNADVKDRVYIEEKVSGDEITGTNFYVRFKNEKTGEWVKEPNGNIGTHEMRIYATKGNYVEGSYIDTTYEVVASNTLEMAAENATVEGFEDGVATYDGTDHFAEPSDVKLTGLTRDKDYKVVTEEAEWINAGEYTVELEGLNKYAGQTATITLKVAPRALTTDGTNSDTVTAKAKQGKHPSGADSDLVVKVTDKKVTDEKGNLAVLKADQDYTYTVSTEGKDTYVTIVGLGNYTAEYKKDGKTQEGLKVKVTPSEKLDLNDSSISAKVTKEYDYKVGGVTIKEEDIEVVENDTKEYKLQPYEDFYIVDYKDNEAAGEATVIIQGKGDYEGTREVTFRINGLSFTDTFKLDDVKDVAYTGGNLYNTIKNSVKVRYQSTNALYASVEKKVYDAEGKEVTVVNKPGVYTVKVTSTNPKYEGTLETTVTVLGESIVGKVDVSAIADQVYTGEAITPDVKVSEKDGDKKVLEKDKDYTLIYDENVNAGTAYVTIKGIGDYSGEIIESFNITKGEQKLTLDEAQVRGLKNRTSLNKDCVMRLTSALKDEKQELTYASSDEKVATVKDGVIRYQGVGKAIITVTSPETDNCKATELKVEVNVTKPGKPSFTPTVSSKTAKKTITVTSSTVRGADGWEVEYAIKSNWAGSRTATFTNVGSKLYRKSIKTMQSNKKYYIRVRAFQTVDGEKVYSSWSAVKTAKTK